MRRLFLFVYIILFAMTANAEIYIFQATSFSSCSENNDGSWSEWSEWKSSSVRINYDSDKDKIKIYADETLSFDVYENQMEGDDAGGSVIALSCVDGDGLKCTIDIRNAVSGGIQVYVRYADINAVYDIVEPPTNIRKLFPDYVATQTKVNSVSSQLSGGTKVNGSISSKSASYLTLSQTSVYASSQGTTQTITVSSNRHWEIKYPTGSIYSVSRNGNTIIVKVSPNPTIKTRMASFSIQTTDGSKAIRVDISQAAATSQSSQTSYSTSRSHSSYEQNMIYQSPYRRYIYENGVFEVTWFGIRAGIGTAGALSYSLFKMRWGPIQFSPLEGTATYNFLSSHSNMDMDVLYQPTIDAFIPIGANNAIYAGIGPSYSFVSSDIWFKTEAGWHLRYGYCTSSDFFFRYDGTFCIGVSIQWSTGW